MRVTSHQPPNEKNAATKAPASAPAAAAPRPAARRTARNATRIRPGSPARQSSSATNERDLQQRHGVDQPHPELDAQRCARARTRRSRRWRSTAMRRLPSGTQYGDVAREPGRQCGGDPGIHDQQALPAIEERDAAARMPRAGRRSRRPPADIVPPARRSRALRRSPCRPCPSRAASTPSGDASVRMIVPGVRKMPTAMTWPTTSAVAAGSVSSRLRRASRGRHQNDRAHGELERARPARPEHAARGVHRPGRSSTIADTRGPPDLRCRARARWRIPSSSSR